MATAKVDVKADAAVAATDGAATAISAPTTTALPDQMPSKPNSALPKALMQVMRSKLPTPKVQVVRRANPVHATVTVASVAHARTAASVLSLQKRRAQPVQPQKLQMLPFQWQ